VYALLLAKVPAFWASTSSLSESECAIIDKSVFSLFRLSTFTDLCFVIGLRDGMDGA